MRTKATAAHANAARSAAMTTHDEQLRIAQNLLDEPCAMPVGMPNLVMARLA
jgi:hypothetical protein